jgi:hypothetical protein
LSRELQGFRERAGAQERSVLGDQERHSEVRSPRHPPLPSRKNIGAGQGTYAPRTAARGDAGTTHQLGLCGVRRCGTPALPSLGRVPGKIPLSRRGSVSGDRQVSSMVPQTKGERTPIDCQIRGKVGDLFSGSLISSRSVKPPQPVVGANRARSKIDFTGRPHPCGQPFQWLSRQRQRRARLFPNRGCVTLASRLAA